MASSTGLWFVRVERALNPISYVTPWWYPTLMPSLVTLFLSLFQVPVTFCQQGTFTVTRACLALEADRTEVPGLMPLGAALLP